MKMYALIHPFGGDIHKYHAGREIAMDIRRKHPEMVVMYVLDNIVYENTNTPHSVINTWCAEIVSRCDGIIVPDGWENSEGCQYEVEAAERYGKEILHVHELIG